MSSPTLRQIEEAMTRFWTDPEAFKALEEGRKVDHIADELQTGLDPKLVKIQQDAIWGKRFLFTDSILPATKKLLGKRWKDIVEQYWLDRKMGSPNIEAALNDFPQYLQEEYPAIMEEFPFAQELADFELTFQQVLKKRDGIEVTTFNSEETMPDQAPTVNPTLVLRRYEYQTAQISKRIVNRGLRNLNCKRVPTVLVIYQDPDTSEVRVQQLGDAAAAMVEAANLKSTPYAELAEIALANLELDPTPELAQLVSGTFAQMHDLEIFVGTSPTNNRCAECQK